MLLRVKILKRLDGHMAPVDRERQRVALVIHLALIGLYHVEGVFDEIKGDHQQCGQQRQQAEQDKSFHSMASHAHRVG